MALKGTGKRQSTCFTSAADRSQKSLITEPWHWEEVRGIFFALMLMWQQVIRFKYKRFYYPVIRNIQGLTLLFLWFGRHVLFYYIPDILILGFQVECFCCCHTESQVLHWSLKQSSFLLVSHCCHLPLSVHVWHSWKDFPCCHDDVATTVECPYSLRPMCHAECLWSGVDNEGMPIGVRSLKNWSCVISFPWDHVWVMKLFEMLEWWYQWSLRGHSFNVETNGWRKNPFLKFWPFFFHFRLHLSVLIFDSITSESVYNWSLVLFYYIIKRFLNHALFSPSSQVLYLKERWTWTSVQML